MVRYIKVMPENVREYLSKHLIDANENEYNSLKSCLIASHSGIAKYKDRDYFCSIDVLSLMDCKPLTKIPNYHKPITF